MASTYPWDSGLGKIERSAQPASALLRLVMALLLGAGLSLVLFLALSIGYSLRYAERIYPGIAVAGIDLGGLSPVEAAQRLSQQLDYPQRGRILLRHGETLWLANPSQLGLQFDTVATVMTAYRYGREGGMLRRLLAQFFAWYVGKDIAPQYVFDEHAALAYLQEIDRQISQPRREAILRLEGTQVIAENGQIGRHLDYTAALSALREQLRTLQDGEVVLRIIEDSPDILDVSQAAETLRRVLREPLLLVLAEESNSTQPASGSGEANPGMGWAFEPEKLATWLTIRRVESSQGATYQIGLKNEELRAFLEDLAPQLARQAQNARFIFNDETRQLEVIQPAVTGRSLAIEASLQSIEQKLLAGEHHIPLEMVYTPPQVGNDATAEQLGIRELVSAHTSYFYGSSAARIHNIEVAAARFHGVLVPPGAVFSMAEVLGDVTLDSGYTEGLIIFGGRTIKGVGGGVCQVSTTLFRTAFFGGYPILERVPHAYRVYYYEQRADGSTDPNLAGLDATVFVPVVDFKFQNDTPYWLLMETYVNAAARTLTWKFYSTHDGRQVTWQTSGLQNIVEPEGPLYEENPELAPGEIKQVDWEVEGADVTVTRTVTRNGEVLYQDTFNTHYMPWRAIYQYGPGTEGMPPEPKP
jgi:vancomycin resistance protein YoaR